ncbi:peptidoglycan-binding domain-containing protein [Dendronalium sp. ChiSLP03b]|uniref:peptidoglycan-binding domain-containing protein n=1 Tax=Dendronalium sp. ChiSLP03b TaxID=3075381 RepID=UPI002AD336E5|nr:peptidoglycan-binding protein [Dendronalium sp. ChiSLP03b]MDZ8207956.1 peptidoglycan-binding protein [Dendronalium sp. ChiSLP03b]
MKGSLKASILNYLRSPKAFRFLSANKFYWLLLCSTSLLIGFSGVVSIAAQQEIAQVNVGNNINRPTLKVGSQGERVSELQAALKLLGFYSDTVNGVYNENTANAVSRFKQAVGLNPDGIVDAATWQRLFPNGLAATPSVSSNPTPNSASNLTTFPVPTQSSTIVPTQTTTIQGVPLKPEPRPATTQAVDPKPEPRPAKRKPNTTQRSQTTPKRPSTPTRSTSNTRNTTTTRTSQIPGVQYTSEGWPILRLGMQNPEVTKLQQRLQRLGFLKGGIDGDFGPTTEEAVKAAQKRYGLEADGVVGGGTWEVLLRRSSR